tara:strand:+ start:15882 stop:16742 length:861 start_codon:yes stop_codon:yes gene_type:complete
MKTIILLITVCNQNKKRIINQLFNLSTQHSKEDMIFKPVFLFGAGGDTSNIPYDTLVVDVKEQYTNLYLKLFKAYKIINKKYTYDYICKIDDDTKINLQNLDINLLENKDYIGRFFSGVTETSITLKIDFCNLYKVINLIPDALCQNYQYASGDCYFISKKAVEHILSKESIIQNLAHDVNEINEDSIFGKLLESPDIIKGDINLTNEFSTINELQLTQNYFTFHPINENLYTQLIDKTIDEQINIINNNKTLNLLKRKLDISELENNLKKVVFDFLNSKRTNGLG